ncbi:MAG: hypothetical protein ACJAZS_000319 [Alteromonas naphthalenivorans]|jgi:hypothetical protein
MKKNLLVLLLAISTTAWSMDSTTIETGQNTEFDGFGDEAPAEPAENTVAGEQDQARVQGDGKGFSDNLMSSLGGFDDDEDDLNAVAQPAASTSEVNANAVVEPGQVVSGATESLVNMSGEQSDAAEQNAQMSELSEQVGLPEALDRVVAIHELHKQLKDIYSKGLDLKPGVKEQLYSKILAHYDQVDTGPKFLGEPTNNSNLEKDMQTVDGFMQNHSEYDWDESSKQNLRESLHRLQLNRNLTPHEVELVMKKKELKKQKAVEKARVKKKQKIKDNARKAELKEVKGLKRYSSWHLRNMNKMETNLNKDLTIPEYRSRYYVNYAHTADFPDYNLMSPEIKNKWLDSHEKNLRKLDLKDDDVALHKIKTLRNKKLQKGAGRVYKIEGDDFWHYRDKSKEKKAVAAREKSRAKVQAESDRQASEQLGWQRVRERSDFNNRQKNDRMKPRVIMG